jgi:hypothetical protein
MTANIACPVPMASIFQPFSSIITNVRMKDCYHMTAVTRNTKSSVVPTSSDKTGRYLSYDKLTIVSDVDSVNLIVRKTFIFPENYGRSAIS